MSNIAQSERATQERVIAQIEDEEHSGFFGRKRWNTLMGSPMGKSGFRLTHFLFANSVSA